MDKLVSCIAVDDEPPALKLMEKYIQAIPALELKGTCNNAVDALALLNHNSIDLIFLDIQMPHILGTDFMRTLSNPPKVIFTTAYRKFAVEGFDLDAVDYLLKPISFQRFLKAVNKVLQLDLTDSKKNAIPTLAGKENKNDFIYLRNDRKNIRVNFEDILFVESLKNYIKIVTKDKTIVTKYSISTLEVALPSSFIRIHRSFIVSKNKIESLTHNFIQVGKYELPVSRSYGHEVEKVLKAK
ncbi:MAG TPA: LytTR family DNA-binding domain-containing protein [Chitinophagaceae bacterium]|nr:LytTR family DNA-binding domain-containing protein [Chitinophagaceae bacterium]